jgi:hypothetical protein
MRKPCQRSFFSAFFTKTTLPVSPFSH